MNKHSPGPWEACDNDGYSQWHIYSTSTNLPIVADLHGDCAETEENARLIEAAPDMLRVLRVLYANSKWLTPACREGAGIHYIRAIIEQVDGKDAKCLPKFTL